MNNKVFVYPTTGDNNNVKVGDPTQGNPDASAGGGGLAIMYEKRRMEELDEDMMVMALARYIFANN